MSDAGQKPKGPRNALGIGVLIAAAVTAYLLLSDAGTQADYESAVARFGQEPIDRLVTATMPLGIAKHCTERYGEDSALIDTVAAYNVRNQEAAVALVAELRATAAMSDDEKRAIEATVMRLVADELRDEAACAEARQRIESGEFDLAEARPAGEAAQPEGN